MENAVLLENKAYWTWRAAGYSELNREELATEQHAVWRQTLTERIHNRFPKRRPEEIDVLEVGTGPGFFAILLAEAGYRVTAIDLTPSMLDKARDNAGALRERIRFMEMNAQALTFTDGQFDVVLSRNVTWNLPNPELAYAEWTRVLKAGGLLLNFDANWYRYLFDDEARSLYARDRENSLKAGIVDVNVGDNFDQMERMARKIPLSRQQRPEWDVRVLTGLGLRVSTDTAIWQRVWSQREKINLSSTPLFMVSGFKS